jgi:hypothetical protein
LNEKLHGFLSFDLRNEGLDRIDELILEKFHGSQLEQTLKVANEELVLRLATVVLTSVDQQVLIL